jgi:predicted RNA-binding protein with PIN domain
MMKKGLLKRTPEEVTTHPGTVYNRGGLQGYTVLIDGYNVIKRHADWERLTLREARRRLIELTGRTRWPIPVSCVIVVFDGQVSDAPVTLWSTKNLHVHFATPSADAHIQEIIRTSSSPSCLLVISDDGEILRTAKSYGVQRFPTLWLFQRRRPTPRTHDAEPDRTFLSAITARRITEELAKRWLDPSTRSARSPRDEA